MFIALYKIMAILFVCPYVCIPAALVYFVETDKSANFISFLSPNTVA